MIGMLVFIVTGGAGHAIPRARLWAGRAVEGLNRAAREGAGIPVEAGIGGLYRLVPLKVKAPVEIEGVDLVPIALPERAAEAAIKRSGGVEADCVSPAMKSAAPWGVIGNSGAASAAAAVVASCASAGVARPAASASRATEARAFMIGNPLGERVIRLQLLPAISCSVA